VASTAATEGTADLAFIISDVNLAANSRTTQVAGTQDYVVEAEGDTTSVEEKLVNNERMSRDMVPAKEAEKRLTDGKKHSLDVWNFTEKLQNVDSDLSKYPIRNYVQDPTTMSLFTNRFEVSIAEDTVLHEFQVIGIPEGRSKRMMKMFVDTAIQKSPILNNNRDFFAADNTKTIVAWKDLRENIKQATGVTQTDGWHLVDVDDGDNRLVRLRIQHVRVIDIPGLSRYINSEPTDHAWNPMSWDDSTTANALNIIVAKCFGGGIVRAGSNKFFIEAGWESLGSGSPLCTIRGYYYSTRPAMGMILLNINTCTSAFFKPLRLSELMSKDNIKLFEKDYPSNLTGLRVYIDYERGHEEEGKESSVNDDESRIKKICGLGKTCEQQTFLFRNRDANKGTPEKSITVQKYLADDYGLELQRADLPAVNLGSHLRPSWFPPEKLIVMPYQIYGRVVPSKLTKKMLEIACKTPNENRELIDGEGMSKMLLQSGNQPTHVSSMVIPPRLDTDEEIAKHCSPHD
jgi:eukaryotic translation initiation factor 2C